MKFFAFVLAANAAFFVNSQDIKQTDLDIEDVLEELKEEIEEKLPESNLLFYTVVQEIAERIEEEDLERMRDETEDDMEKLPPLEPFMPTFDVN